MTRGSDRFWWGLLIGCVVALHLILGATGWFHTRTLPDTPSYFGMLGGPDIFGAIRYPLYGAIAASLGSGPEGGGITVAVQVVFHIVAVAVLFAGARRAGMGGAAAFCLAAAALLSKNYLTFAHDVFPEQPAIDATTLGFGLLLASLGGRGTVPLLVGAAASFVLCYLLRPAFLPVIAIAPLCWLMLAGWADIRGRLTKAAALLVLLAVPFVAQSGYRAAKGYDFNLVSFGGFQASGLAAFILSPETIDRLPAAVRPTADEVLAVKTRLEQQDVIARTPEDPTSHKPSFIRSAFAYYGFYAGYYDDMLYKGIVTLQHPDESWVEFNKRLMAFSMATLKASPAEWAAWIAGGTIEFLGKSLISNFPVLLTVTALVAFLVVAGFLRRGRGFPRSPPMPDLAPLLCVVGAWVLMSAPLVIVVTFTNTRYVDTAGVLLPAVPLFLLLVLAGAWRRHSGTPPATPKG